MNVRRLTAPFALCLAVALITQAAAPDQASAELTYTARTYEVQVQYWFFDTDYYYWSTVFESANRSDAEFVYALLANAKENGDLNHVAAHDYWRYFAVNVRLVVRYQLPQLTLERYNPDLFRAGQGVFR